MSFLTLVLCFVLGDDAGATLRVGAPVAGVVAADAPSHARPAASEWRSHAAWRGVSVAVEVERAGAHVLTARSPDFDAYLVLADASGTIVAEDDDGFFGTHARIETDRLAPGAAWTATVLAPEGSGSFTLSLEAAEGATPVPSAAEALAIARADRDRIEDEEPAGSRGAHASFAVARAARAAGDDAERVTSFRAAISKIERLFAPADPRRYEEFVAVVRGVEGPDSAEMSSALANLGAIDRDTGSFAEARRCIERAIEIRSGRVGADAETARMIDLLASIFGALGDRVAARDQYARALEIRLRVVGEDNDENANTLNGLCVAELALNNLERAVECGERSLAILERLGGHREVLIARTLTSLGDAYRQRGDASKSLECHQRALDMRLASVGEDHADTARSLTGVGLAQSVLGRGAEAVSLLQRVADINLRIHGEDHPDTVTALQNLGIVHSNLGHGDECIALFRRAAEIQVRILGEDNPESARALYNLGLAHASAGDNAASAEVMQRVVDIRLRILGEGNVDTSRALYSLAVAKTNLGRHEEALPIYQRALDLRRRALGENHVEVARNEHGLGVALANLGRHDEAMACYERALAVQLRVRGEDQVDTLNSLNAISSACVSQGATAKGIEFNRRALAVAYRILPPDDRMTSLTLKASVDLLTQNGDTAALEAILVDHHRRCVEAFGADDSRVAPSLARLALLDWGRGDRAAAQARLDEALRIGRWENASLDHGCENLLLDVANVLAELGRLAEARIFAKSAYDLVLRFHAGDVRVEQRCLRLAVIELDLGEYADAERHFTTALAACQKRLGDDDQQTQEALFGLARAIVDQGSMDAESHLRKLLAIRERLLPKDHQDLQDVRLRLAEVLRAQGKQTEADRIQDEVTVAKVYRPSLIVNAPDRIETMVEDKTVVLDAVVTDYGGIGDVRVVRDGTALSIRALEDQAERVGKYLVADASGQKATLRLPLTFRDGQTTMELIVSAQNRRGQWSDPQTFRIEHRPPRRDLYVLALGVQDYDDDTLDLKCSVKDVDDFVAAMSAQEGGFYSRVHVRKLVDREVTIPAVKRSLDQFLVPAQPRDTIVVFVSGHGVRTEHSDYFFLTSDATPKDPYAGVDRATIESLVTSDKLHANRRLLLLDTCQAGGAAPGSENTRGAAIPQLLVQDEVNAFKSADDATGLYILASSTDDSFAREANGNGLFTRALLDGLAGAADTGALGDKNGLVEIEELKNFGYFQVLESSEGKQRATVPKVISGENFPLGRAARR